MPHIVEEYAKHCGVKISKPKLIQHFFALPCDKYITISCSKTPCIDYYYWEEVLKLLKENFEAVGVDIKIVQMTVPNVKLENADLHVENATINQVNYILANSLLHLCPDDPSCHIASAFDRPIVAIYSHSLPEWSGPYWNVKNKPKLIVADLKGDKPSLSMEENPSLLNRIYPDVIANEVLKKLGIPISIKHNVVYIGENFHFPLFEVVPDFTSIPEILNGKIVNLRDDLFNSNENISFWLSNYKCTVITNREIPIEILETYKLNVAIVNFICEHDNMPSLSFLEELKRQSIKFNLFVRECSEKQLSKLRNKYFDYGIDVFRMPKVPEGVDLDRKDLYLKSKKILLTKDGVFLSHYHWKNLDKLRKSGDNDVFKKVANHSDFIEELNHFYIYEQ